MDFALAAFVFAPGLALGSFLNVVAARVPLRRSIVRPGSACMACDQPLRWYDNLPLVSYALLRGRCRSCKAPIGLRYPAVELATAGLLAGCVLAFGFSAQALRSPGSSAPCLVGDLGDRPRAPDRPEPDRAAGGGGRARRADRAPAEPRVGARRARRLGLPLRRRARLSGGDGHGRRQARAPARRDARAHGPGRR